MATNSFTNIISTVHQTFLSVIKKNALGILIIALLPRIQAYFMYTDNIGNWASSFLEESSSIEGQLLQVTLVIIQYVLIATIYHNTINKDSNFIKSLIYCLKKIHKIIIVAILYLVMVLLGLALFVLPGVYLMVRYALSFISVIVTDLSIIGSFKNSKKLVKGNWGFSFLALAGVISVPSLLFGFIGYHCSNFVSSHIINEIFIVLAGAMSALCMLSGTLFIYNDLSARQKPKSE